MLLRSVARLLPFALLLGACAQDEAPTAALPTAPDGGLVVPDAALLLPDGGQGDASAAAAAEPLSGLLTLAEFRGDVTADGAMVITTLDPAASSDPRLRRLAQGLCTLSIVQDGVAGSGPANSLELVTGTTGLDGECDGYLASPLFCGAVTVRSFYTSPQTQVFAQIQSLVPSTGFGVQNGDVVPGASSGLGSWAYGDLGASAAAPANAGVRNWVFARSGGNFTFTGRVVANVTELCDGLDNDCDGTTDEGIGCRNQGQSCAATADCSGALVCTGSFCSPAGCTSGEHVEGGSCVSDTRSCSITNGTGSQSYASGSWAACGNVSCNSSYHAESGLCASDTRSCTAPDATDATESWTGAEYGPCTASACLPTHHLEGGECLSNTGSCSVTNGSGTRTYNAGAWSSCTLTGCDAGFHVLSGACELDTRSCTLADGTGSQSWLGSVWGVCTPTSCTAGYHVESGACASDARNCLLTGGAGNQTWNGNSWNSCAASACYAGFTLNAGSCAPAGCGNGLVEAGEGCDDGNLVATDGCTATCAVATCGDGLVQAGIEGCDDGNTLTEECNYGAASCIVCNATCASAAGETDICGDGILDAAEVCDDGNTVDDDSCATSCLCGAGYHVESGVCTSNARSCSSANATIAFESWTGSVYGPCTATACDVNYHLEGGACANNTRACSVANATTATQSWTGGDYTVCAATGCAAGYSLLAGACAAAGCGNGAAEAGEACDDGNTVATDGCTSTCTVAACGDGVVQAGIDGCDDGNTVTEECGYGAASCAVCSATCTSVAGETDICGDGVLDAAEVCDDGNSVNGDSCSNGCVCGTGFHFEGGVCTSDTRSCLLANGTGTEQWNGLSYGSTCSVATCNSGYHIAINSCAADVVSCSLANATAATQTWSSGTISYGSCTANSCAASYHVESGACAANVRVCTLANGTATETWDSGTLLYGSCTPGVCNSGYHIEDGACLSNIRSCSPLPANTTAGTQTYASGAWGGCTATTCASGYWVNAGTCALLSILGTACTIDAACASGFCATGPTGTANDRCAPTGMNYIPAGTFTMGSPSTEVGRGSDETQHSVTISRSFFMGQTEVTQGQWKALSDGTNPSWFQSTTGTAQSTANANDSGPAEYLDWYAAVAFANARSAAEGLTSCYTLTGCTDAATGWKDGIHSGCTGATFGGLTCTGYRLPTESEWEYSARGGTTGATYLGNLSGTVTGCTTAQANLDGIAWWCMNSGSRTNAVGGKTANSFGLYDMLGNVREWTADWYDLYSSTLTDPLGAGTGSNRVIRGGSLYRPAENARAASRHLVTPANRYDFLGFRLARTVTRGCAALPANATAGVEAANSTGWGACEATACAASYHLESGACLSDTRGCMLWYGTGSETWTGSSYGGCVSQSCPTGFHDATTISFDSDSTIAPLYSGAPAWAIDGGSRLRSGVIPYYGRSTVHLVTTGNARDVSFRYYLSSEEYFDYLYFLVDGTLVGSWSGEFSEWAQFNTTLNAGEHTLTWTYEKDGNVSQGSDAAWIDDIQIGGSCVSDTVSCAIANGTGSQSYWGGWGDPWSECGIVSCNNNYHIESGACLSNTRSCSPMPANMPANATAVTESWNSATSTYGSCAPGACNSGYHVESGACMSNSRSCSLSNATVATESWTGTGYGSCTASACATSYHVESGVCVTDTRGCMLSYGTGSETWTGSSYGGCVFQSCLIGFHLEAITISFDSDSTIAPLSSGAPAWAIDGGSRLRSGVIPDNGRYGRSTVHLVTTGNARDVSFRYYLSSEEYFDYLYFLVDGTLVGSWSGEFSEWAQFNTTLNAGEHTLTWTYEKDGNISQGSDAAWIDDIQIGGSCVSDVSNTRTCSPLPTGTTAGTQTWTSSAYGSCTASACSSTYWLNGATCVLKSALGAACTLSAACTSGFCATGPDGTANDRCAPTGMNFIPAGTFTMGSPLTEVGRGSDEAQHTVTLSRSFFMAQTEVTQGQWKALSGGINPSWFQSTTGTAQTTDNANDSAPAENMDWYAAVAFANARSASEGLTSCYTLTGCTDAASGWKDGIHSGCTGATFAGLTCTGYRLPTESEWEYAARGGTTAATYLGNLSGTVTDCTTAQANLDSIAWWCMNSGNRTQAVSGKTANSFGLSDMLGNVYEWTGDWYGTYPGTVTDPLGAGTGSDRVFRGGSWLYYARYARAAARNFVTPGLRSRHLGFRLSRTPTRGCTTLPSNATAGVEAANASGWGACEATTCATSYHVEGGACVLDTRSCSPLPANTTAGTQTWNSGTSAYGTCTASACASGYSVVGGVCLATLGTACTLNAACASGFCATGPTGTANDRCAPTGMNYIPAGTFTMGSYSTEVGRNSDERQHYVTISRSFFMAQTELTQGEWKALSGGLNPSWFQSTTGTAQSTANANNLGPAEYLDWYAALAFANAKSTAEGLTACYTLTGCTDATNGWKDGIHSGCTAASFSGLTCTGYRLPTESEWEYAARAGTTTATYGGNLSAPSGCVTLSGTGSFAAGTAFGDLAWYVCNAASRTQATGGKLPNTFGLYDMLGNVREWTGDWYDLYSSTDPPTGPTTGSDRVIRGGSLYRPAENTRAASRHRVTPANRYDYLGFRLARTVTRGCTTLPANATAGVEAATATGWGACEATACATSYHVESGLCVSNTRTCSPMPAGTTAGTQTYASGAWGGCTATTCASGYWLSAGACLLPSPLGIACTLNAQCASGVCATGPDGTANDRCAPTGMNYIPAGTFTMGSPPGEVGQGWDETQHSVTISRSFFMAQTEVTQLEWKALSGGINPSARRSDSRPVENPDWYAALAFANARSAAEGLTSCYALAGCTDATNGWQDGLHSSCTGATLSGLTCTGYRLPTESEWEYAARAGTSTATYLGNLSAPGTGCTTPQANLDGIAWWCRNAYGSTQAVASKAANSFGLFDMLGNVSEWTGDLYGAYPGTVTDPTGPTTGSSRVHRGGSWYDTGHDTRAAGLRRNVNPDYPSPQKGFRLVRTVTRGCAALPANATAGVEAANASGWGACEVVACATGYVVNAGACIPDNLGTSCTANAQCAAGNCATGPDGTANDRCAPTGMNYIPAGTFTMGSPSEELGRYTDETQHSVTISRRFFLGQTEVTQGQWKALSGGTNPSYFQSTTGEFSSANDNDNGPVEQLDWYSAVAFANARSAAEGLASCYTLTGCTDAAIGWKDGLHSGCWGATFSGPACTGYRLPTESEWEYAARAVTTTATYAGNLSGVVLDCTTAQANLEGIAWWCRSSGRRTQATGSKLPNTFGLFDMLGNVYEWVGDWYGAYPGTVTDPTGATSGLYRGMRGGSLINEPRAVRSAWRDGTTPDSRNRIRGLRLARTVP